MKTLNAAFATNPRGKKIVWAVIIACLIALVSVFAFGANAIADASNNGFLNNLFGTEENQNGGLFGFFNDENADEVNITVEFTNNYRSERAKKPLAVDKIYTFNKGESISFTVDQPSLGMRVSGFDYDQDKGLRINAMTSGTKTIVTVYCETGLEEDTTIAIKYGNPCYAYTVHNYYENEDGSWQSDYEETTNSGSIGIAIPTNEDIYNGLIGKEDGTFEYDGYGASVINEQEDAVASVYYRRVMKKINFDANEGIGGPGFQMARVGYELDLTDKPAKAGYEFDGWYDQPDGGNLIIDKDVDSYVIEPSAGKEEQGVTNFYAHWYLDQSQKRYITVVYWGENAERIGVDTDESVCKEDYGYISEAYIKGDLTDAFDVRDNKWSKYLHPYKGTDGSSLTSVTKIDADKTGSANVPIKNCYDININTAHVDKATAFQPDNYAVYNVYLKRVTYQWDFYSGPQNNQTLVGSINARWNQNITEQYKAICNTVYGKDYGNWKVKYSSYYDTTTYQSMFTNMNRVNRIGKYKDDGSAGYLAVDLGTDTTELRYYIQNVDGEDSHSNVQSSSDTSGNYTLLTKTVLQNHISGIDMNFSSEEFINIEGFVTPSQNATTSFGTVPYYSDTVDAPKSGLNVAYESTSDYNGWNFYYKRAKNTLCMYAIDGGDDNVYFNVNDIMYGKTLGDVSLPENIKGYFDYPKDLPESERNRQLKYYVPENPGYGKLDPKYVFDGWAFNNAVGSEKIDLDSSFMPNSALTIYAKWKPKEVTASFQQVEQPKTEIPLGDPITFNGIYGQKIDFTGKEIPVPMLFTDYYFEYWYYRDLNGNVVYFEPTASTLPDYNILIYPEYSSSIMGSEHSITPVDTEDDHCTIEPKDKISYIVDGYKITFNGNDVQFENSGESITHYTASGNIEEGKTYTFKQWEINTGSGWQKMEDNSEYTVNSNIKLRAVYNEEGKEQAEVITEPSVKEGLVYDGKAKSLATAGEAENGIMKYVITKSDEVPAKGEFKVDLQDQVEAGHYFIYYYAEGIDGYDDSAIYYKETNVQKANLSIYVSMKTVHKNYTGDVVELFGSECFEANSDKPFFNPMLLKTESWVAASGVEPGTYLADAGWDKLGFYYVDESCNAEISLADGSPEVATLIIDEYEPELDVYPEINSELTYNGEKQKVIKSAAVKEDYEILYGLSASDKKTDIIWHDNYKEVAVEELGNYTVYVKAIPSKGDNPLVINVGNVWVAEQVIPSPVYKGYFVYNGNVQYVNTPESWENWNNATSSISGVLSETNAGTYEVCFQTNYGYKWDRENENGELHYTWTIEKADQNITFSPEDVTICENNSKEIIANNVKENASPQWTLKDGEDHLIIQGESDTLKVNLYAKELHKIEDTYINFSISETTNYNSYTSQVEISIINKKEQEVVFNPEEPWVIIGRRLLITANFPSGEIPQNLEWSLTGEEQSIKISVYAEDFIVVEGLSEGTEILTLKYGETASYLPGEAAIEVKSSDKIEQQYEVDPGVQIDNVVIGEHSTISVTGLAENPTLGWETLEGSDKFVFTSNKDASVINYKAIKYGTAVLKLHIAETEHYAASVKDIYINITQKQHQPVVVDPLEYDLTVGESTEVRASNIQDKSQAQFKWEIVYTEEIPESERGYAIIDDDSSNPVKLFGDKAGKAKLLLTINETDNYAETSVLIDININDKPKQDVHFDKESLVVAAEETSSVTIHGLQEKPELLWTIENTNIAQIQGDDTENTVEIKGLSAGNTRLKVVVEATSSYSKTEASIEIKVVSRGKVFLANRSGVDSIIKPYSDAVNVSFTNEIPQSYNDCIPVDADYSGSIRAYKIYEGNSYSVKIASTAEMASNESSLAGIFKYFRKLESVDFGNLDFTECTTLQSMFYCCESLTEIDFQGATFEGNNTSKVTSYLSMFEGCKNLVSITFTDKFVFGIDVNIEKMFRNCRALTYIVVPEGMDLSKTSGSGNYMFDNCTNLPGFNDKYTDKTKAFSGVKYGVTGYFVTRKDVGISYLANRNTTTNESIIFGYEDAVSVEFKSKDSTVYSNEYKDVDIEHLGQIKAYKVVEGNNYKVIIASFNNIYSSGKSFEGIFKNFKKLKSVDFGDVNMSGAVSLKSMFYNAKSIEEINVSSNANSGFNTLNVEDYSSMFEGCSTVKVIKLDDKFVVNNNAKLFQMFRNCNKLEKIYVKDGTDWTSNTADSTRMFDSCISLNNFDADYTNNSRAYVGEKGEKLGYFSLSGDKETNYLGNRTIDNISILSGYEDAVSVTFSGLDTTAYSTTYKNVDIENSGSIKAYKIEEGANYRIVVASSKKIASSERSLEGIFKNFKKLTSVNFGNLIVDSATSLTSMFYNCNSIKEIKFDSTASTGFNVENVISFRSMFENCTSLQNVIFTKEFRVSSKANIGHMFLSCSKLTEIMVPSGTDWSCGTGASDYMFTGCISLPNWVDTAVDSSRAYTGMKNNKKGYLTSSEVPKVSKLANRRDITSIIAQYSDAVSVEFKSLDQTPYYSADYITVDFNNLDEIRAYKVAEGSDGYKVIITSKNYIAASAKSLEGIFKGFKKLKTVNFGDLITTDVTSLQSMFYNCVSIASIDMSSLDASGFNTNKVTNFNSMFESCTSLTSVKLGKEFKVSNNATIRQMFKGDVKLSKIIVPENTDWTNNTTDCSYLFLNCVSLPGYSEDAIGITRAYVGEKAGVKGYFVTA